MDEKQQSARHASRVFASMSDRPHPIAENVGKLVAMLGSDQDGEALAAARALGRVLSTAGLSFIDLAEAVKKAPLKKTAKKPKPDGEPVLDPNAPLWSDSSRQDRLTLLRQLILERWLTPFQMETLNGIHDDLWLRPHLVISQERQDFVNWMVAEWMKRRG